MTKDFSKHSEIIEGFRGKVLKNDFEAELLAATQSLPKSERFLLKMELKRLASPCLRLIDLRGLVDGECREYVYEERKHYLDTTAIKVFEENIASYGSYSFGVYEAVTNTDNNFRVIYQKEKAGAIASPPSTEQKIIEKTQYPAKLYKFGGYHDRCEERMNYAIPVNVTLSNKETLNSTSTDISVNGCKVRVSYLGVFAIGQEVSLKFTGLEEEFKFGEKTELFYQIKNIEISDDIQLLGLERVIDDPRIKDGFKHFLNGYIQGHKRRYKINLDNTISALQSRSLETAVLPKINELPVFLENNDDILTPRYVLTCENNQNTFLYWQDENKKSVLHYLINEARIGHALKQKTVGKALRVYSFIHESKGRNYFYSIDEFQLREDKAFMQQFLGFAASKKSFAIFEMSLLVVDVNTMYSPLTLSNSISKKNQYLNTPPSEDVKSILANLPYVMVIEDITDKELIKDYQTLDYQGIDINRLKYFGHKKVANLTNIDELGINYKNQRQEPRFIYNTQVSAKSEGVEWLGKSVDFSISGLKVELEKPAILKVGDIVHLSFAQLQKITSSFELARLPYQVVRINKKKTTINLRVHIEQHQHIGRSFFRLLIEKNKNKLTPDEYALMIPGMARALINTFAAAMSIPYLIIQMSGSRYKIESIACSEGNDRLLHCMNQLSDRKAFYNLFPLMHNLTIQKSITATLKAMQPSARPESKIIYVAIKDNEKVIEEAVVSKQLDEFEDELMKNTFINTALKKGQFFAVRLLMSRANEPELEFLNPELSYISAYAIHRGKQLEQDIWSGIGTVQLYDITDEVLMRHQLMK